MYLQDLQMKIYKIMLSPDDWLEHNTTYYAVYTLHWKKI